MRTKIVYVLSSDETDVYLEQALLSVFSLRKHNSDACVELVVDQVTKLSLKGKRSEITKYVDKITVVEVPEKYNKQQKSRWLKTSLRKHVTGDYLFLDTDTIITDSIEEIDEFPGVIGAVKDEHTTVKHNSGGEDLFQWSKQDGWTYFDDLVYFNSGVMYVRDCELTHNFYQEWNVKWQKSCEKYPRFFDQSLLAATNESFRYPIKELDGEWNCQPFGGISYIYKAKIIHYWRYTNNSSWLFYDKGCFGEIKELGYVSEEISEMIDNAKGAFVIPNRVIGGRDLEIYYSPVYKVCKSNRYAFSLFNTLSRFLLNICCFKRKVCNRHKANY